MTNSDSFISRRRILQGTVAAFALGGISQPVAANRQDPLSRYIVGVDSGHAEIARRAATEVYRELDFGSLGQAISGWFPTEAISGLARQPHVRYVEAEGEMHAIGHTTDEDVGDPSVEQVLPWGIDRVDAEVAHHHDATASGSSVAIIDTGIDPDHETLAVTGGVAFVGCAGDCSADWADDHGHGTHCAGTAAARDNGIGVVGTSTAAALYAVKVLDENGGGTYTDVAAGIEWTADQGIDVGSLSLGGSNSSVVRDACQYASGAGTLLVAAAGNDGRHPVFSTVNYPAAYEEVIAVSAIDEDDDIASFSSRGPEIELGAPGVRVLSSLPGNAYDRWSGTSMACPHVAGAGAQVMAQGYSNVDARQRLNETAEDLGLATREQGNGLVDVAAALGLDGESVANSLAVETHEATEVGDVTATLNGELTQLEGFDEATVSFAWGESGTGLPNSTAAKTLTTPGTYATEVTGLETGTEYEFRARAEAENGDSDVGAVLTFSTDGGGETGSNAPSIQGFVLADKSNPRWARVTVDWAVADVDGDLGSVESALVLDGVVLATETSAVGGSEATGEHDLRERDGASGTYHVTLTVTDAAGNDASETKQIEL